MCFERMDNLRDDIINQWRVYSMSHGEIVDITLSVTKVKDESTFSTLFKK